MNSITKKHPFINVICILVILLQMNFISVRSSNFNILGLVPIHSTDAKESKDLVSATNKLRLETNASVAVKVFQSTDQEGVVMEIMLETFSHQNNLTAIIGPNSQKDIHQLTQFLDTIPEKVLHIVYNPVTVSTEYLHNIAPSVSLFADLLVDLMLEMKWNYIAVMRDSEEYSILALELFKEKARRNKICIGSSDAIHLNESAILKKIKFAQITGILVFGKTDTVRSVSRNGKKKGFNFIFASNENLHTPQIKDELPDLSIQVFASGFYYKTNNKHFKYINDSVYMALTWFNSCQNLTNCHDLQQDQIINGSLDIYQKIEGKQVLVGSYQKELNLNSKIKTQTSFCTKECEKCHELDIVPNLYYVKNGTYYIVIMVPLHKKDNENNFACSQSLRLFESVDIVEAAKFAVKTSSNPNLGLIVLDTCLNSLVTIEQLISINYTKVLGVVGGFFSLTTIPAAEVLTSLHIPQISYGAESHLLADRVRFPYFQRTIISTEDKCKAIIFLCKKIGWKAINVIYNKEPYGISSALALLKYAKIYDICIVNDIKVDLGERNFQTYLNKLRDTSTVKVVVTFLLQESQNKFLHVLNEDLEDNEFFVIEAYGLGDPDVQKALKNHFKNMLIVEFNKPNNTEFLNYYTNMTKSDMENNPWAKEFIEVKNKCRFEGSFNVKFSKNPCEYKFQNILVSSYHDLLIKATYALINGTTLVWNNSSDLYSAQEISEAIRKTEFNILGKKQRIFDDDGNSLILHYSLMRIKNINPIEYEKLAIFDGTTWESSRWNELASFTSTCDTEDSCTVCYVKQPYEIQQITLKNIQYNAFAVHPENILYSMVKSDELEVREEAIKRILAIRKTDSVYTAFVVLDIIVVIIIIVVLGLIIWKKRENLPCGRKS